MKPRMIALGIFLFWSIPFLPAQGADTEVPAGKKLFENTCADCHRTNGQGLPDKFPALDKNAFVIGEATKVIDLVMNGQKGKLGRMPSWKESFNDQQIAAIITYIRQAWSNRGTGITTDMVKQRRK